MLAQPSLVRIAHCNFQLAKIWPEAASHITQSYPVTDLLADIIIGEDYFWDIVYGLFMKHESLPLVVLDSALGKVLAGSLPSDEPRTESRTFVACADTFEKELQRLWMMEYEPPTALSEEEEYAVTHFEQNIHHENGYYTTTMMLRPERPQLISNFRSAYKRLCCMEQSMGKDPRKKAAYIAAMREYEERGDVEQVHPGTMHPLHEGEVFYLPHRGVFRWDRETSQCRVVFDASAKDPQGMLEAGGDMHKLRPDAGAYCI